jgi:Heavy metal associated domain 2
MFPEAFIAHQIQSRIRLKIPARKGDASFFVDLRGKLVGLKQFEQVESNYSTGSILLVKKELDVHQLARFAAEEKLFHLILEETKSVTLKDQVAGPMAELSHQIKNFTGGELDLPGTIFISLLIFGLYELARGNFTAPPWYTAFWYAFGIFSKSMIDRSIAKSSSNENFVA